MTETTSSDRAIREIPLAPGGAVEVSLTSNELRLRGADTDRVVVRTRDGEAIDDHIVIEPFADGVRIKDAVADFRLGPLRIATRRTADLDIEVPRTARISVRTLSGDVDASGIGAGSRWASASGDLRLRIEGGVVAAESMSGDITIDSHARIEVSLVSVSGDVRVRAPELAGLRVSTTSGDVDVAAALAVGPEHKINAVSGDVQLATGSQVRLEAQTLTGDVRSTVKHRAEGGRGRRTLVVGDGRVRVTVRTMSGDVRLREGPAAPVTPPSAPVTVAPPMPARRPRRIPWPIPAWSWLKRPPRPTSSAPMRLRRRRVRRPARRARRTVARQPASTSSAPWSAASSTSKRRRAGSRRSKTPDRGTTEGGSDGCRCPEADPQSRRRGSPHGRRGGAAPGRPRGGQLESPFLRRAPRWLRAQPATGIATGRGRTGRCAGRDHAPDRGPRPWPFRRQPQAAHRRRDDSPWTASRACRATRSPASARRSAPASAVPSSRSTMTATAS